MENRKGNAGEIARLLAQASDGTSVRAEAEGEGRVILILHPGMNTAKSYEKVAARLGRQYRVIRLHRRQYRLDLKTDPLRGSPCTVAEEVEHVLAIVKAVGEPVFLFGHSSGGTVALEALVASPSSFVGGMIYEPALVLGSADGLHLAGDWIERNSEVGEGLRRARQALAKGQPGRAIGIFTQVIAGWQDFLANSAGALTALVPAYRQLIPCQIDDLEAMERLGIRLDAYSKLKLPVAMVCGERSPDGNLEMVSAVADVLPRGERITLSRQGHACHVRDPQKLADVIENFAKRVFE
ncbi:alpha/beta fold hydrolase [Ktedonobacter robiniae]|uniref:Alpha/beta hydrolase n=1 Tax=Ktedonobacter robiniae TaxID=2778365 RepID=A0ABQ3UTA0_9CHLR|nr:alpha/beta hydrolase [Ktedonobacter robiniae]GHO55602.1 alpha/beta hydrolase [Ktedonobacter robiniae]